MPIAFLHQLYLFKSIISQIMRNFRCANIMTDADKWTQAESDIDKE